MKIHIISIFPEMFEVATKYGVLGRSVKQGVISLDFYNPRDYTDDKHATIDGRPYGGGPGMVMLVEPMTKVIRAARKQASKHAKVVYLSPQGKRFDHRAAESMSKQDELILLSGRYEGIDQRVLDSEVDEEWSIGDYVLSGGEMAAMVVIDAVARLLPNSLGNAESAQQDSFVDGLLDCPHYAKPDQFDHLQVPEVLLSGDHARIARWRRSQALGKTWLQRPDLLDLKELTDEDLVLLEKFKRDYQS